MTLPPKTDKVRVLPCNVYDQLMAEAEKAKGIGDGVDFLNVRNGMWPVERTKWGAPVSALGMLMKGFGLKWGEAYDILERAGLMDDESINFGLRRVMQREGISELPQDKWPRISFASWCAELNVVRSDEPIDLLATMPKPQYKERR